MLNYTFAPEKCNFINLWEHPFLNPAANGTIVEVST